MSKGGKGINILLIIIIVVAGIYGFFIFRPVLNHKFFASKLNDEFAGERLKYKQVKLIKEFIEQTAGEYNTITLDDKSIQISQAATRHGRTVKVVYYYQYNLPLYKKSRRFEYVKEYRK